jgi:pilus assembly protein CpaE
MIAQISARHRTTTMFQQMAQRLTGHAVTKKPRGSLLAPIMPIIRKLSARGRRS